jgi:glycosyltransferase involved in cell wall biosynthesis
MPAISVVVATRNRPDHALACVASILASGGFHELIVVDQSDGHETQQACKRIATGRLRYVRTDSRGVTRARNTGMELSSGDVVAFTDDDCRVTPDWLSAIGAIFESDPEAAVICGRVRVPPAIQPLGFTEHFEPYQREWRGQYPPFGRDWGITANLALRREVVARVGAFDPMLGAGAPLRSGGEPDFIFRVLRSGMKIVNAREVVVDHLGFRAYGKDSQKLMRGYGFGTGAALFKHVRLGDGDAVRLYVRFVGANVRRITASLVRGNGPVGLGYLVSFISGSWHGYEYRVDRTYRQYLAR